MSKAKQIVISPDLPQYAELNDLACAQSGGQILFATDDFFAVAENMISDSDPIFIVDKFTEFGKWMDGWETRRKRIPGHDWCIVRLGTRGVIHGFDVDTAFFTGNFTPKYSIQAARLSPQEEALIPRRISQMGSACRMEDLLKVQRLNSDKWHELVPVTPLRSGYEVTRHNYQKVVSDEPWTHIRVNMYPDGGIARLRVFGVAKSNINELIGREIDLISMKNGALCQGYSNAHYGHPKNLIKPGRGVNMADGWETARRLDRPEILHENEDGTLKVPGYEWAIFRLANTGRVTRIDVDTCHFKGNYPDSVKIEGTYLGKRNWTPDMVNDNEWTTILSPQKLTADAEHWYIPSSSEKISHIRITMVPDGGISRVRILGYVLDDRTRT